MTNAGTPRATWSGTISCGLVTVPVKLYQARSDFAVKFNQLNSKTGNRVKQRRVDEKTGNEVPYEDIVAGFNIGDDRYVVLSDEDLETAEPQKTREIGIQQFAKLDEIPHLAIKGAYYVGPNTGGGKAYRLLAETMRDLGVVGLGRFVMRTNEYLACLSPMDDGTILCETLAFADEIRPHDRIDHEPATDVSGAERKMATQLVKSMTKRFKYDDVRDEHRARLLEIIEAKAAGTEIVQPEEDTRPAVDLLAALEQSLEAVSDGEEVAAPRRQRKAKAAKV